MTFADAQRAIYIDFECLKGSGSQPPHPALLGVLHSADGDDEQFEQIIVDERLAPAAVANKRCRVATTAMAVSALVEAASQESRKIVGWSFFDRDRMIESCPERSAQIQTLYVNALEVARPWRKILYPRFAIERDDPHAPRHTLDKYARLAGYPDATAFAGAAPAKWIRHLLDRLRATGGRYRKTNAQTKRDWHKLLAYNRHDCLALRQVVLKASRELHSWRAYERTRFCADDGVRRVCFVAGSRSPRLERLLDRHQAKTWAFVTASNPGSLQLAEAENAVRHRELIGRVEAAGYQWLAGEGTGPDASWPPEKSLLILGISLSAAVSLGREFEQLAIVAGRRRQAARLVPCARAAGERSDSIRPSE